MLYTLVVLGDQHSSFSILLGNTSLRKARNWIDFPNFIEESVKQRSVIGHACLAVCFQLQALLSCTQKATASANNIARKMALAGEHRMLYSGPLWGFALKLWLYLRLLYKLIFCLLRKHIKMFLSRKGGSQKCLGFRLPGFSALCNKKSKNCTQPLQSLFPRGGCVCIMCRGESNFWYIFADSLNCKL